MALFHTWTLEQTHIRDVALINHIHCSFVFPAVISNAIQQEWFVALLDFEDDELK